MRKESKFFKRIFYSYLIIFTILTLIVEIFVCSSIVVKNRSQSVKVEAFFEDNCVSMDNKVLSIFQVVNMLSENDEIEKFAKTPYETYSGVDYYALFKLSDMISRYTVSYLDIDCRIGLFRDGDNLIFDSRGVQKLNEYLTNQRLDIKKVNRMLTESKTSPLDAVVLLGEGADVPFVTILCWHKYPSGDYIYYLVSFDKNYFFPMSSMNHEEFFAVVDKTSGNLCLNQSDDDIFKNKKIDEVLSLEFPEGSDSTFKNNLIVKKSNVIQNMLYAYYNPGLYSVFSYILIMILLLVLWLLLLILGYYLSRYIASRLYGPVHNVFSVLGDEYHQEYEDDMLFLSDSVKELVTNNKRLQELAEKNKVYLKYSFIKDLLTGNVAREQISATLKEYNLDYLTNHCRCIVCEYDNIETEKQAMDYQKIQTLKSIFIGSAEDQLRINISCEVVSIDRSRFAIVTSAADVQILNRVLMSLVNHAEEQYNLSLVLAVGKMVSDVADVDDSYMSALNLLEYRLAFGDKRIIHEEDMEELGTTSYYYPVEIEKNLIYNVLEGNVDKCEDILMHLFYVNFTELSLDKHNIKDFKFAVSATVKRILKQINKTAEDIFGQEVIIYLELNAAASISDIENSVRNIVVSIAQYVTENSKNKKRVITQSIIKYIDENYNWDISLRDVADHFCLSEGHIGRLLKNDLNTSFKQYLNERRIEVAKALLLSEENIPVGDVASLVGCNSAMTFIRMFKKHTGVSPGEYKKNQS